LRAEPAEVSGMDLTRMVMAYSFFNVYELREGRGGKGILHEYRSLDLTGEKVIVDGATDLMWQQSGSQESMGYQRASSYIDGLNKNRFAGFSNWRLPTLEEAYSLMESSWKHGKLYIDPVFDSIQKYIWTCDREEVGAGIFGVYFNAGYDMCMDPTESHWVRAVRSD